MNKIIIALLVIAGIAGAWFLLTSSDVIDYTATVDTEITELENELADIEAQVEAGSLSEADATAAKVRIVTRLDTINAAALASENTTLSATQRAQLSAGLERLKVVLVTYAGTLATIETTANETNVQAELSRRGGSYNRTRHLNLVVADAVADLQDSVETIDPDFESNASLDGQIDAIEVEAETDVNVNEVETQEAEEDTTMTEETDQTEPADQDSDEESEPTETEAEVEMEIEADMETPVAN